MTAHASSTSSADAILVVDDDAGVRAVIQAMLVLEGYAVSLADSNASALRVLEAEPFDLVITDILMPGGSGFETISGIRSRAAELPILAISGGGRVGAADCLHTARCLGANATLAKPFSHHDLLAGIRGLLD